MTEKKRYPVLLTIDELVEIQYALDEAWEAHHERATDRYLTANEEPEVESAKDSMAKIEAVQGRLPRGSRAEMEQEVMVRCCFDGWVPGEYGVERCDECRQFADDDEAAAYVAKLLRILRLSNSHADPAEWEVQMVRGHRSLWYDDDEDESETPPPACGHSSCRQGWIDTGESYCSGGDHDV